MGKLCKCKLMCFEKMTKGESQETFDEYMETRRKRVNVVFSQYVLFFFY